MAVDKRHSSSVNCLYALGGGRVIDGTFPEPRVLSTACRAELATYFVSTAPSTVADHGVAHLPMYQFACKLQLCTL